MRLTFLILLSPLAMFGQLQFMDDFSDSNFTTNPSWTIDTGIFSISPDKQLQLNDTAAGEARIYASSRIAVAAEWNFKATLQFNPSASNYAEVYFCADSTDLQKASTAVFVRLGGSTQDRISLFLRQQGNEVLLTESADKYLGENRNFARIRVTRSVNDEWALYADTSEAQTGLVLLGEDTNAVFISSRYTGLRCVYTVTRADKMFFDDFWYSGDAFQDVFPPEISGYTIVADNMLRLDFNERLQKAEAEKSNHYALQGSLAQVVDAVLSPDGVQVFLEIAPPLQNRSNYTLTVSNLEDKEGNELTDTSFSFAYILPERGDVILNELLPDPIPVIGIPPNVLPAYEYIELYNRTAFDLNLSGWVLNAGNSTVSLDEALLPADSFLVLARPEAAPELAAGVNFSAVPLSTTALTNAGTLVSLSKSGGEKMDEVLYDLSWYRDVNKDGGGWSLERIDPDNLCGGAENWRASESQVGGTPGKRNSVLGQTRDTIAPVALRASVPGDSIVRVHFSEWIDDPLLLDPFAYEITPEMVIDSIKPLRVANSLLFYLSAPMQQGEVYRLTFLGNLKDCSGNPLIFEPLVFGLAQFAGMGDLYLNELLFNPVSGGADYVELYNASDQLFDLEKLRLASYIEGAATLGEAKEITSESYLLLPGAYVCLSENPLSVQAQYTIKDPASLFEASDLPPMADDEGSIVLLNANLTVVDSLRYTDNLHSPALLNKEGVSLERARYDAVPFTAAWYSAASTAGFGTPGYLNSQQMQGNPQLRKKMNLVSRLFSPNNDSYQDKLEVHYSFNKPNYLLDLMVYSKEGYALKKLATSLTVSQEGILVWDGTDHTGQLLGRGAYLLVLEYFHTDGEKGVEKAAVVLTY